MVIHEIVMRKKNRIIFQDLVTYANAILLSTVWFRIVYGWGQDEPSVSPDYITQSQPVQTPDLMQFDPVNNEKPEIRYFRNMPADRKFHLKSNGPGGISLIHKCAMTGCYSVLETILTADAKVNSQNKEDLNTPLHLACAADHPDIVKLLLKYKANPEIKNSYGDRPIHMAAQSGCLGCIVFLALNGADINSSGQRGLTPLHFAVITDDLDMVLFLLNRKADKAAIDHSGLTPFDYADNDKLRNVLTGREKINDFSKFLL